MTIEEKLDYVLILLLLLLIATLASCSSPSPPVAKLLMLSGPSGIESSYLGVTGAIATTDTAVPQDQGPPVSAFDHAYLGNCWNQTSDRAVITCDPWPDEFGVPPFTTCRVNVENGVIQCGDIPDATAPATNLQIEAK